MEGGAGDFARMPFLKRLTLDGNKLTTLHGTGKPRRFLFSSIVSFLRIAFGRCPEPVLSCLVLSCLVLSWQTIIVVDLSRSVSQYPSTIIDNQLIIMMAINSYASLLYIPLFIMQSVRVRYAKG
eukprot:COSAG06_NODE_1306_length_9917_cov_12.542167_7_plen_124_part_00